MPRIYVLVKLRDRFLLDFQSAQFLVLDLLAALQDIVYASLMRWESCSGNSQLILLFR